MEPSEIVQQVLTLKNVAPGVLVVVVVLGIQFATLALLKRALAMIRRKKDD